METICDPDMYEPSLNDDGTYVDMLRFTWPTAGLRCNCATRKDKVYTTRGKFTQHTHTQGHRSWLKNLTNNKVNYYNRFLKSEELVKAQQKIITELSNKIAQDSVIITALTTMASRENLNVKTLDLLSLD